MTARWVVEEVQPHRDLNITWQPISLFFKNKIEEGSPGYEPTLKTLKLLRVMESVRALEGDAPLRDLYWEYGRRLHHDNDYGFDVADALASVGLDSSHVKAFEDESFDAEIHRRMDIGLELAGDDIGTPIIAFDHLDDEKVALFGPVITRVPTHEQALQLWDGFIAVATVPGFWELKRTRTEGPDCGERP